MGQLSLFSLPNQFDVVWCRWPRTEDKLAPGPHTRPTLVLDVLKDEGRGIAKLIVAYGCDASHKGSSPHLDDGPDLIITTKVAWHALGMHKPTCFSMWTRQRRELFWHSDYFVPEPYKLNGAIIAGSLTDEQLARVKECFEQRALQPYW